MPFNSREEGLSGQDRTERLEERLAHYLRLHVSGEIKRWAGTMSALPTRHEAGVMDWLATPGLTAAISPPGHRRHTWST